MKQWLLTQGLGILPFLLPLILPNSKIYLMVYHLVDKPFAWLRRFVEIALYALPTAAMAVSDHVRKLPFPDPHPADCPAVIYIPVRHSIGRVISAITIRAETAKGKPMLGLLAYVLNILPAVCSAISDAWRGIPPREKMDGVHVADRLRNGS